MADKVKVAKLKEIQAKELAIYEEKNTLYGDSFASTLIEHGPVVLVIRLEDKLNRIKSLLLKGMDPCSESIIDTLTDLANYANMGILELTSREPIQKEPKTKKKEKAPKREKAPKVEKADEAPKGPLDDLNKKDLLKVVKELGGEASNRLNRTQLCEIINSYPKAKIAIAITAVKNPTEATSSEPQENEEKAE